MSSLEIVLDEKSDEDVYMRFEEGRKPFERTLERRDIVYIILLFHDGKKEKILKELEATEEELIIKENEIEVGLFKNKKYQFEVIKKDDIINKKENKIMSKKMVIEGMMCGHCEARVKKVLEDTTGVSEAIVSHEAGTAVVTCDESVTSDVLKSVVEDAGYTVVSVD